MNYKKLALTDENWLLKGLCACTGFLSPTIVSFQKYIEKRLWKKGIRKLWKGKLGDLFSFYWKIYYFGHMRSHRHTCGHLFANQNVFFFLHTWAEERKKNRKICNPVLNWSWTVCLCVCVRASNLFNLILYTLTTEINGYYKPKE